MVERWGVVIVLALVLAGCAAPHLSRSADIDLPSGLGELGPRAFTQFDYDLGTETHQLDYGLTFPYRLRGSIHLPSGGGPFPILLFQHGYHGTCNVPLIPQVQDQGSDLIVPRAVCPDTGGFTEPDDSFRGYNALAEDLASRGYAVISQDVAEINGDAPLSNRYQFNARSAILLHTLDHLRDGTTAEGPTSDPNPALAGRLDFAHIGLMGHSNGGAGVALANADNQRRPPSERHDIRAVFGLATGRVFADDEAVQGVAYGALLPSCDGDLRTLPGAATFDGARYLDDGQPKYQFLVLGTNHNFYNTKWAEHADDAGEFTDPFCGQPAPAGGRLSVPDTQVVGRVIMEAFFRAHVGGEAAMLPFLQGRAPFPATMCPPSDPPVECRDLVQVAYHPPGHGRGVLAIGKDQPASGPYASTQSTTGNLVLTGCVSEECPDTHVAGHTAVYMVNGTGAWRHAMGDGGRDWSRFTDLSLRAASRTFAADGMPGVGPAITALVEDGSGRTATLSQDHGVRAGPFHSRDDRLGDASPPPPELLGLVGYDGPRAVLTDLAFDLQQGQDQGIDLTDVRSVTFTIEGPLLVVDVLLRA